MRRYVPDEVHRVAAAVTGREKTQVLWAVASLMLLAQLGFRAWALYPSWFFADDYVLMVEARRQSVPDLGYLLTPFNSHVMPLGRLVVWVVAHTAPTAWGLAATGTLVAQLAASVACVWMLQVLFGARWAILPLLGLYLTSAIGMPGLMWWAAALNQLPLQLAIFLAVGSWVRHLRGDPGRWVLWSALSLAFGLLWDVRAMLVAPLLVYLALAYFQTGSLRHRVVTAARRHRAAAVTGAVVVVGYTAYYVLSVPPPFEEGSTSRLDTGVALVQSMLGTALTTGVLGGPWRWYDTTPPIVLAGPPQWAVQLSWVVLAAVLALSLLRRTRTGRAWALLLGYALALLLLLTVSRGVLYGGLSGLEYRYLTDLVCIVPLVGGLAFLELRGAVESSAPRSDPLLRFGVRRRWVAAGVGLVCVGGLVSSVGYVGFWHDDNANRSWVRTAQAELRQREDRVDLADQVVLPEVMPAYTTPYNRTRGLLPQLVSNARFPDATDRLEVLGLDGSLHDATVKPSFTAPPGTVAGCGTRVGRTPVSFSIDRTTFPWPWWVQIGYLSSASSPVTVSAGDNVVRTQVRKGLHTLWVSSPGVFGSVRVSGLRPGTLMCVDTVEVGDPVAREDQP